MPWYVLYTKPRNEKKTAQLLEAKNITVYCPQQETIKQWSDRKKKVIEPLFRSYIFVKLENYKTEQVEVLATPGAVRFLWWLGKPGLVKDEEIAAIREFLNDYKGSKISVSINPGEDVTITEGPFREQTGKLIKVKGNKAFLQLSSLGWNITAEIPVQHLSARKGDSTGRV